MHYLVVLCDHYDPAEAARFHGAIAAGRLVTQGNVPAMVAVVAGFEARPWEGAIEQALADYEACDQEGHLRYVRGWAVLDDDALDRLARSAGPMYRRPHTILTWVVYGPLQASNVRMVLRDAQIGLVEHASFDQSVRMATAAAGLYQVTRWEAEGRDGEVLVRHADGTALAFATEAEAHTALMRLVAQASPGGSTPDYGYRVVAPGGAGVKPLDLTPNLAAAVARILPAEERAEGVHMHGVILANGTALIRMDDRRVSWFVVKWSEMDPEVDEDESSTEDILDYLDRHGGGTEATMPRVSAYDSAAEAEPFALPRGKAH